MSSDDRSPEPAPAGGAASFEHQTSDKRLMRLFHYWQWRRRGRRFPARSDIDPAEFAFALGRVSLVAVAPEPPRFRYRLVATRLTEHLGYEMTGKSVDDIPEAEMRAFTQAFYERVVERAEPTYARGAAIIAGHRWQHETLALPLSSDGRTIDMLLIYRNTDRPVAVTSAA